MGCGLNSYVIAPSHLGLVFCYFLTLKHEKANVEQTKSKNDNNKDQTNRKDLFSVFSNIFLLVYGWGRGGHGLLRQTDPNFK